MAKKRRRSPGTTTKIVRMSAPRAAAPIIRVSSPRAPVKRRRGRGSRSRVGGGALTGKTVIGAIVGGAILGWIEKNYGAKLPTIPVLGVKGTIAGIAYFAHKNRMGGEITRDIAIAAAATAGYQMGKEGKVSGDVDGDDYVHGISAQV